MAKKHKNQDLSSRSKISVKGKEIIEMESASNALRIVPLAFSFPSQDGGTSLKDLEEDRFSLGGIDSPFSQEAKKQSRR